VGYVRLECKTGNAVNGKKQLGYLSDIATISALNDEHRKLSTARFVPLVSAYLLCWNTLQASYVREGEHVCSHVEPSCTTNGDERCFADCSLDSKVRSLTSSGVNW
jgi:hypothetical protein